MSAAGELLAFDPVYRNPQTALKAQGGSRVEVPARTAEAPAPMALKTMGEFLSDVPRAERLAFLSSLMLKNGHIVSAYLAPLRKSVSEDRLNEILDTIYANRHLEKKLSFENPGSPARYTEISELLKNVPHDAREEFLDNLVFRNGAFLSAYVGGLRKSLGDEGLRKALRALATNPAAPENPKALCWGGTCQYAKCVLVGNGSGQSGCRSTDLDWSCDSSCN